MKILLGMENENHSYKLYYFKKYKNEKRIECFMIDLKSPTSGKISVDQLTIGEDGPGVGERYFIFVCAFLLIAIIDKLAVLYFD